jgi:aminopeptidase
MRDERVERVADVLVDYSVAVKAGELVEIRGSYVAEPLILAIYRRCLDIGAHPVVRPTIPAAAPLFYKHANEEQLKYVWPTDEWMTENLDVVFSIICESNTRQLSRVDPAKQVMATKARQHLFDRRMQRSADGDYRWTLTLFPTEAHAQEAEMSLAEYEDFFYGACLVGEADPIAEWRKVAERHARLIEWMKGRNEVHLEGEGTDLILEVGDRIWEPADGTSNFPDGEIFTAPKEDKTRGHITYSYPALYGGQAVAGIRLEFDGGRVVDARADQNEEFLIKTLDTDPGARVLGELGIGTNFGIDRFTGEILLDEKIGGTIHLAVGASYPETGGTNQSAVHWDMVCDLRRGGRITVDGDVLMEDGKLAV